MVYLFSHYRMIVRYIGRLVFNSYATQVSLATVLYSPVSTHMKDVTMGALFPPVTKVFFDDSVYDSF
jgi:hypothetical protein